MPIFYSFRIIFTAMLQIFFLGLLGYLLAKRKIIYGEGLRIISGVVVNLLVPCFIFIKLIENFDFKTYANWWIFPLISFGFTIAGFLIGILFVSIDKSLAKFKREFVSLVAFQNSGYLPLILVNFLLPHPRREQVLIYLFLFLLGFNLVIWSLGVFYLVRAKDRKFQIGSLLSPPVIAVIAALLLVGLGLNKFIPGFIIRPIKIFGDYALALAIFVVGGNLSGVDFRVKDKFKAIGYLITAKLILLPLLSLALISLIKASYEISFLILLQAAVPSATSLSVITSHYKREDNIISLGIFWTHLASLITIPLFLILYSAFKFFIFGYFS